MVKKSFPLVLFFLVVFLLVSSSSLADVEEQKPYLPPGTDFETVFLRCILAVDGQILCQKYRQEISFEDHIPESTRSYERWLPLADVRRETYADLYDTCRETFGFPTK